MPIIADIDAGFGNEEATYLLTKQMIEAGACAIQIENQVSDVKQCGHQAGKVTVPHEDFIAKLNAIRYARKKSQYQTNQVILLLSTSISLKLKRLKSTKQKKMTCCLNVMANWYAQYA